GPDDLARLGERADLAARHRLHEQVADQRRLFGPGNDRESRGVRGPAAQELVAGTAADDVDLARRGTRNGCEQLDRLRVLEREALEDAADDGARLIGFGLAGIGAERADARRHLARLDEGRIVRLDEASERSRLL